MPRGYPDYLQPGYARSISITDVGEVVRAIMGVRQYDGHGRILYATTWQDGVVGWELSADTIAPLPYATIDRAYVSPMCMRFAPYATGYLHEIEAVCNIPLYQGGNMGVEWSMRHTITTGSISIGVVYAIGNMRYSYMLQYDIDDDVVYLYGDTVVPIISPVPTGLYNGWITYKLVMSTVNNHYDRLIYNDITLDLSGYACQVSPGTGASGINLDMLVTSKSVTSEYVDIGHIIVTGDDV